mgnify:CR=1 FL=1|tara:strand:- start:4434 stop:6113 length:1680 start_codon:yes stop_codon:yes gene_type:complete
MSYIKIQANQATISATQNLVDFDIPSYMAGIDMNESFINLTYTITDTEPAATAGSTTTVDGIHNYIHVFNGVGENSSGVLHNSALVRRATLTATKAGQLESIQRADLVMEVKQLLTKNIGDFQGASHEQIANIPNQWNYGSCSCRNLVTEGVVTSTTRDGVMRVNLKDILGLGESTLNLNQLGDMRLSLECNLDKFTLKEVPTLDGTAFKRDAGLQEGPTIMTTALGANAVDYYSGDKAVTVGNPTDNTLDIPLIGDSFIAKKNMPFWVGQKVNFILQGATPGTDDPTNADVNDVTITEILFRSTAGSTDPNIPSLTTVTLTFSANITAGNIATNPLAKVVVAPIYAATKTHTWKRAELVCKSVRNPPVSRGLSYRTYQTIQDFAAATLSLQRTYEMPRDGVASLVCFDTSTATDTFSGSWDAFVNEYQVFVDNVGITDRPVPIQITAPRTKGALHNVILEKTLEEMGLDYKNNLDVMPSQISNAEDFDNADFNTEGSVINNSEVMDSINASNGLLTLPVMYKQDGTPKLMTIHVRRGAGATANFNLVIFTQVQRTIEY